jgi:threonine/homoserine/homoserine lactone efflux protein
MAYLAVLGVSIGRRAGFAATLGVAFGRLFVGLAAALGLAVVIANSRLLYEALRWAGALPVLACMGGVASRGRYITRHGRGR